MATLYEINKSIEEVLENLVNEETGEVNEEMYDKLNQLHIDRKEKIENCILMAKSIKADGEAIQAEAKKLLERANQKFNRSERILDYGEVTLNGAEFETNKCRVTYRPSQTVEIVNEEAIPDKYLKVKTTTAPDKMAIKKVLSSGGTVPGTVLVDHLRMQVK